MSKFLPGQMAFGADYNPDQWPKFVWQEDIELMLQAKVNLVTLPVFGWANIETADGRYVFDWLDEALELLHKNKIGVDLATATASPPAWLLHKHPEIAQINSSGARMSHGGRQNYCISSPIYREKSAALADKMAERYGSHPALKMWHINNEYGCHNPRCYCDTSAAAWRLWLEEKYQNLESLNQAWGTQFWSQRYHDWSEIQPPRETPAGTHPNPTMSLDFHRFSNEEILKLFRSEREAIRAHDKTNPITTNFMSMKHAWALDYWMWAKEVDFVSTDHYLISQDKENYVDLAFQADLTRGLASGQPWLLMEHSTSAVNWQSINLAKANGEMQTNSISHIARGSSGAMFFQWRQSTSGSEKFHSAMVPHAGTETRIWNEVVQLGSAIQQLSEISEAPTEPAEVAMIFDYESWWALSQPNLPSSKISYPDLAHDWYRALWHLGIRVDFLSSKASLADLKKYKAVLLPTLYLTDDTFESSLKKYALEGGALIASYLTAISDLSDSIKLGGYGGSLINDLMGVRVTEFVPLEDGDVVNLDSGLQGTDWSQHATASLQNVSTFFTDGLANGAVAISRAGACAGWYVGTRLTRDSCRAFFSNVMAELDIAREGGNGVEIVYRGGYRFEIDNNLKATSWAKHEI